MLRTGSKFLNTCGGDAQVEVVVDGIGKVGQLYAVAIVVEDEVLVQSGVRLTHVPVFVLHTVDGLRACRCCTGPSAAEVVHVAPLIECDGVPTRLVDDIDYETIVVNRRAVGTPVVTLPALSPDIGESAHSRVVVVYGIDGFIAQQSLMALCGRIEAESVGQRLAILEGCRVKIDAPLGIAVLCLHQFVGFVEHWCLVLAFLVGCQRVAVEGADDVDLLIGSGAERSNVFQQDAVGARLKLLTLMVEHDILFV